MLLEHAKQETRKGGAILVFLMREENGSLLLITSTFHTFSRSNILGMVTVRIGVNFDNLGVETICAETSVHKETTSSVSFRPEKIEINSAIYRIDNRSVPPVNHDLPNCLEGDLLTKGGLRVMERLRVKAYKVVFNLIVGVMNPNGVLDKRVLEVRMLV